MIRENIDSIKEDDRMEAPEPVEVVEEGVPGLRKSVWRWLLIEGRPLCQKCADKAKYDVGGCKGCDPIWWCEYWLEKHVPIHDVCVVGAANASHVTRPRMRSVFQLHKSRQMMRKP